MKWLSVNVGPGHEMVDGGVGGLEATLTRSVYGRSRESSLERCIRPRDVSISLFSRDCIFSS